MGFVGKGQQLIAAHSVHSEASLLVEDCLLHGDFNALEHFLRLRGVDLLVEEKGLASVGSAVSVGALHAVLEVRLQHGGEGLDKVRRVDRQHYEEEHAADLLHVDALALLHLSGEPLDYFWGANVLQDADH